MTSQLTSPEAMTIEQSLQNSIRSKHTTDHRFDTVETSREQSIDLMHTHYSRHDTSQVVSDTGHTHETTRNNSHWAILQQRGMSFDYKMNFGKKEAMLCCNKLKFFTWLLLQMTLTVHVAHTLYISSSTYNRFHDILTILLDNEAKGIQLQDPLFEYICSEDNKLFHENTIFCVSTQLKSDQCIANPDTSHYHRESFGDMFKNNNMV